MASKSSSASPSKRPSRLPTVSASQALSDALSSAARLLSTGLPSINRSLQDASNTDLEAPIGLPSGRVVEVYGPPGAGKTTVCLEAAADCLSRGKSVVWIDAASEVVPSRLRAILGHRLQSNNNDKPGSSISVDETLKSFQHYRVPSLAHFLALVLHAGDSFPPENSGLIVVDALATLVEVSYPRTSEPRPMASVARRGPDRFSNTSTGSRRQAVIARIASRLAGLAAQYRIPALVTNGVVTRVSGTAGAFLRPALTGREWDDMLWSRLVLFRDWATPRVGGEGDALPAPPSRFVRVLKANGRIWPTSKVLASTVAFDIEEHGVNELPGVSIAHAEPYAFRNAPKRSFDAIDGPEDGEGRRDEADASDANSENDYGWTEEDAPLAGEGLVDEAALEEQR